MKGEPKTRFCVQTSDGRLLRLSLSGRCRWALLKLMDAGEEGHDPIRDPGVRWSSYVHLLRNLGIEIETIRVMSARSGNASGLVRTRYGIYRLTSKVNVPGAGL